jgi:hypothetical protein
MLKKLIVVTALALSVLPFTGTRGAEFEPTSELMRRKLAQSQKVLEGVAVNDFEKIAAGAEELIAISKEAEWQALKTPRYELYSNEFRRSAETLIKNAKDKNLDAAALTYVDLTLTCVKCHKHVREVRMTRR